jgi:membrane-associated phospholipid phosphatase
MTFAAMIFSVALQMLKRFLPFVGLLIIYESFRGVANDLNHRIHYTWMPHVDRWLFGKLPTVWLQQHWWHGHVQWYDFAFYTFYMLHFVLPIALGIVIWRLRDEFYWQYAASYVFLSFAGFLTYLVFPAAPPWMASDAGYIPHITRISSSVWYAMGIHNFPSLYNSISPNPVAAVPSLHAAYATLFVLIVYRLFGKRWALLSLIYPFMIILGTIYMGEHYVIDAILGVIYASLAFVAVDQFWKRKLPGLKKSWKQRRAPPAQAS